MTGITPLQHDRIRAATSANPDSAGCGCCATTAAPPRDRTIAALPILAAPAARERHSFRPFFVAGIAAVLTGGAAWGTILLWRLAAAGSFTALSINDVNAHGHVQIFGWVVLFIMGFALEAFPRMWRSPAPAPRLTWIMLGLMAAGILVTAIAMPFGAAAAPIVLAGGALEILAVSIFAGFIARAMRRRGVPLAPSMGFILLAALWLVASTAGSAAHAWLVMTAPTREAMLAAVATYQGALRDAQLHGVALAMILGVSMRVLPHLFGVPVAARRTALAALVILAIAVAAEIALTIALRLAPASALSGLAGGITLAHAGLAAAALLVAWPWRLWRPLPLADPSGKFVRAAYGWLAASLVLLLAAPVHAIVTGIGFSHAYSGAVRHAFTVGFVSMMIMGIGAKVVRSHLAGADRRLGALWLPFALINVGCALRVVTQLLTDWTPAAYRVIGASGAIELAALAIWSAGMLKALLAHRTSGARTAPAPAAA
jgi:hypothetical protein